MIQGAKKISELTTTTLNGSEVVPVVQDDGLGNLTTFKVPVSSVGTDTNFANTNLTLNANRTHNLNGNLLTLNGTTNGMVVSTSSTTRSLYGQNTGTGIGVLGVADSQAGVRGESNSGAGVSGQSTSSYGGNFQGANGSLNQGTTYGGVLIGGTAGAYMYSDSNGYGAIPYENAGSAGAMNCQGKALFNGTAATGSALVQVDSTTQGVLLPRMTTTQRNAIGTPATGLEIYNTTTNRKEHYNGTYWAGSRNVINILHSAWASPADGTTAAFGAMPIGAQTAGSLFPVFDIELRGNGVIRACTFNSWASGTAGSGEAWSLFIRHNLTDYLIATVSTTAPLRVFENTALNIPYVDGDIIKMIYVNPTWATNPTQVIGQGTVTTE